MLLKEGSICVCIKFDVVPVETQLVALPAKTSDSTGRFVAEIHISGRWDDQVNKRTDSGWLNGYHGVEIRSRSWRCRDALRSQTTIMNKVGKIDVLSDLQIGE